MELPELITRASIESEVEVVISRYHREQQGFAPTQIRASLVRDMIYVRSTGVFTPTEQKLTESEEGQKLVRSSRRELRSLTRRQAESEVARAAGVSVLRSYWDMDVRVGEQLEAYVLAEDLEEKLRHSES
jgi:uncharacterized protein YbcI